MAEVVGKTSSEQEDADESGRERPLLPSGFSCLVLFFNLKQAVDGISE